MNPCVFADLKVVNGVVNLAANILANDDIGDRWQEVRQTLKKNQLRFYFIAEARNINFIKP